MPPGDVQRFQPSFFPPAPAGDFASTYTTKPLIEYHEVCFLIHDIHTCSKNKLGDASPFLPVQSLSAEIPIRLSRRVGEISEILWAFCRARVERKHSIQGTIVRSSVYTLLNLAYTLDFMNSSRRRREILEEISKINRMERGSVSPYKRSTEHGEVLFYNHNVYEGKKTKTRHVRTDELEELQAQIEAYKRFRQLISEYEDLIIKETRNERLARLKPRQRACH
jgi:hypothetical protein